MASSRRMMLDHGYPIGRFKVRGLMAEANLVSRQPGGHRYMRTGQARLDIPNKLNRQFDVAEPNQIWCGNVSYVWAGESWHYLAAVMDLHTRRVVDSAVAAKPNAELVFAALEQALGERSYPSGLMFHSDQGSQLSPEPHTKAPEFKPQ